MSARSQCVSRSRFIRHILTLVASCLVAGCSERSSTSTDLIDPASDGAAPRVSPAPPSKSDQAAMPAAPSDAQESWFAMYIEGTKVGHGCTTTSTVVERGKKVARIDEEVTFSVNRNGQRTDEKIASTSFETPDGELLRFRTEINSGQQPIVCDGRVRDGKLAFEMTSTGNKARSSIPWLPGTGGFKATEHSLAKQPMQPGEWRKLTALMVGFNQVAEIELAAAAAFEPTNLLDHSEDLLRIDWTATLPAGGAIRAIWWTNREGDVLKMQLDALHQISYRTTREIALAEAGPARFDLLRSTTVAVNRPLEHPQATRRVRYRVSLESGDPARVFATGGTQRVTAVDPHTAEIVVRSLRPGTPPAEFTPGDVKSGPGRNNSGGSGPGGNGPGGGSPADPSRELPPTADDRQPNNLIQSDSPRIVALAKEAAGPATEPWETSKALERFVHDYITGKNYLKAFSTALEVAESREGSCTQHAVLLAALARARGIPARVAIGLVYTEDRPGFAFHAWNEVWLADRWIPLDATRAAGGTSASYLKLSDSSLQAESAYSCFLPVAQVIGQAKIEILEAE